jgi:hypothetical protein
LAKSEITGQLKAASYMQSRTSGGGNKKEGVGLVSISSDMTKNSLSPEVGRSVSKERRDNFRAGCCSHQQLSVMCV